MQIKKIIDAIDPYKAARYMYVAMTTASVCIAIMCMGVIYVNVLDN